MATCTFFGHRATPNKIEPILYSTLVNLVENHGIDMFLVGHEGNFDRIVRSNLRKLKIDFPHITFFLVLAYMPGKRDKDYSDEDYAESICPYVFEKCPPKYAISKRNRWLISESEYVVTYVTEATGGAAKFKELAEKKGKVVINLADMM